MKVYGISVGELADRLRPLVLAACDEGETGTSCLNGTQMIPLHRATVTAIYLCLEDLAKVKGEQTIGQEAFAMTNEERQQRRWPYA